MQFQNPCVSQKFIPKKAVSHSFFRVLMKGITWSRDSHGLFDYESRHLTKKTMKTSNPSQIVRKSNDLELLPIENGVPPYKNSTPGDDQENRPLLNIINENGKFHYSIN